MTSYRTVHVPHICTCRPTAYFTPYHTTYPHVHTPRAMLESKPEVGSSANKTAMSQGVVRWWWWCENNSYKARRGWGGVAVVRRKGQRGRVGRKRKLCSRVEKGRCTTPHHTAPHCTALQNPSTVHHALYCTILYIAPYSRLHHPVTWVGKQLHAD